LPRDCERGEAPLVRPAAAEHVELAHDSLSGVGKQEGDPHGHHHLSFDSRLGPGSRVTCARDPMDGTVSVGRNQRPEGTEGRPPRRPPVAVITWWWDVSGAGGTVAPARDDVGPLDRTLIGQR